MGINDNAGEWEYAGTITPTTNGVWYPFATKSESSNSLIRLNYYFQNNTELHYYGQIRVRYEFPVKATGETVNFYPADINGFPKQEPDNIELFKFDMPQELTWNPATVKKIFEVRKVRKRRYRRYGIPITEQNWSVSLEFLNFIYITPEIQGIIGEERNLINIANAGNVHILLSGDNS